MTRSQRNTAGSAQAPRGELWHTTRCRDTETRLLIELACTFEAPAR